MKIPAGYWFWFTGSGAAIGPDPDPDPATFEQAFSEWIAARSVVAARAGGRVFSGTLPQRATLPAVVFSLVSRPTETDLDGPAEVARPRIQIDVYAWRYADAAEIAAEILGAIHGRAFKLRGRWAVTSAVLLDERDLPERNQDGSDAVKQRRMLDFRFRVSSH